MEIQCLLIFAVFGFVCISCDKQETVFAVFKSGYRSPEKSEIFPYQPFTDEKDWPLGFGQLTNSGKNEMYNLGKLIRVNYNSELGINPASLSAKSLDIDRCMESAQLVAIGAYPPVGEFVWNRECNWQPFAVHLFDRIAESALNCGNEYDEMKQLLDANTSRVADELCDELISYLHERSANELNLTCDTLAKISNFYIILKENNLAVPFYVDEIYEKLTRFRNIYTAMKAKTKCEQISSARVLFDIKDKIEEHSKHLQTKIKLYAITSEKLETILTILEDEDYGHGSNVSALFIDLFSTDNENNLLQFNLLHEGMAKVTPFKIRGCHNSNICTSDEFFNLFNTLGIEETSAMSGKVITIIVLGTLLGFVATLTGSFLTYVWIKRSRAKRQYEEIAGN